jgi:signal transduction histidine kinase
MFPDDMMSDLLARSANHELRQSLWLIVGYAELLARADLTEADRAVLLAELRAAAARLSGSLEKMERPEQLKTVAFGGVEEHRLFDLRA